MRRSDMSIHNPKAMPGRRSLDPNRVIFERIPSIDWCSICNGTEGCGVRMHVVKHGEDVFNVICAKCVDAMASAMIKAIVGDRRTA